ncbi:hypothetical protein SAMN05444422_101588 [Halobiforma haloterrestris]|uniref:Uncharacterized protein n=1 Tax=Natronobacterium haloterrestre TaxID=148448 RepID=A0A1I1DFE5_NATHA|nr:hypothetical protein [Halobiforma haloterrestris]SFB73564.1 hypothetical protein SAMN05444422_101588 [Halobiforma haloterrestris]
MGHTNWETTAGVDEKRSKKVWTHTAPHYVNDGECDGEVSFSEEVLAGFVDDEESDDEAEETAAER